MLTHPIIPEHRQGFRGHFAQNPSQQLRFDNLLHGREARQADRRALAFGLQTLKVTGRTKGTSGFEDWVEQPK